MLDEFRSTLITWDKATSRIYSPVTANASDENGRKLVVQIVNSGQVEDLTGATLHLYWETRDKLHDGLDVFKAIDLKKGEFELSYTTGMLSNKGVLNANLVLIDTVGRVVSERFKITVTEGIDNDAIQSENSFTTLTQALIDISNLEQNYAPRLNDLTAQLADIRHNELHVGEKQPFATIGSAIDYWTTTLLKAQTTIYVHPGQYKEKFELDEANISIIGYDKKNTRIWYDLGAYGNEPVRIKGGQVYFANLTVESVFEDIGAATGCYAMHVDRTETTGSSYAASNIIVENCDIISGNHSGVGMGTENDQHVVFINCNVKSSNGAGFLYHSSTINMLNQKLTMINTNCYSVDYFAATFTNPTPNLVGMVIEIINCNFKTDRTESYLTGENQVNYVSSLPLSINSFGNNVKKLNKNWSNQVYQLTADDGSAKTVTDCNDVFSGFFRCDGGTTGLNTPTAQWCSGYAVSYSTTQYVVQYAWTILDGFKMYKRYKTNTWSAWVLAESPQPTALTDSNGNAINISDLNNATKTGFHQCDGSSTGLNTPTASVYLAQTIAYSQTTYILQYAWDVLNGFKKYKRSKGTVSWTAWIEIVEP